MNKDDLLTIVQSYQSDSIGVPGDEVSNDRASALDRFHGRPYGDEEEGSSQVVSMDLSETVEWIIPPIMETFLAGGELGQFRPNSAEDEKGAIQETRYVNHVIMKDNPGFIIVHDTVHDALLLKNGYFKHYWDETEKTREVMYTKLTEDGLASLFTGLGVTPGDFKAGIKERQEAETKDGKKLEILEYDEYQDREYIEGIEVQITKFDIKLKITEKKNRCTVLSVPTEEIRVHKSCTGSLQDSPYTAHITTKTRSELVGMGLSKEFIYNLTSVDDKEEHTDIRDSRDSNTTDDQSISIDRSMDLIEYGEHYVLVDFDDDGQAELRKVVTVGGQIPDGDEWNEVVDSVALTGMTGIRMAHRHEGISLDDRLKDLQRIKTTLTRQMLNNIYATNNIKAVVNNRVHMPDVLTDLPGGKIRIDDDLPVGDAYLPIPVQSITDKILPMITYVDQIKGERTGVNETTTTQDPDVLKNSTKGAFLEGLAQAGQKVRMIERMLAETGIKELFLRVHEIIIKHQDFSRQIKLSGEYVDINPTEWRERTDFDVKVGLGTGTREEKQRDLMFLAGLLEGPKQLGLVTPEKAFRFFADMAKTLGENSPEKYMVDPTPDENGQPKPEYAQVLQAQAQPQPNPLAEMEQIKGQMNAQIEQLKGQQKLEIESIQQQAKAQLELFKQQTANQEKEAERQFKLVLEQVKNESKEAIAMLQAEVTANKDLGKPGIGAELEQT